MQYQLVIRDEAEQRWLGFKEPCCIIQTNRTDEVVSALHGIDALVREKGLIAAGFISYEAATAFDRALVTHTPPDSFPLLWFGMYERAHSIDLPDNKRICKEQTTDWRPSVEKDEYKKAIAAIKQYLADGETYQVNFTMRLNTLFQSDPWDFFLMMINSGQSAHAAYVDTGRFVICSASPEMFFKLDNTHIQARPMKGTSERGLRVEEDAARSDELYTSEKNRAENLMIVDMIRNDIGRIARIGTVNVPKLFTIEQFPTLWQMTSTVEARTDAGIPDIIQALFPCASITGAPKVRTMEIIKELENSPRKIYTGSIGYIAPERKALFNVAIRTVLVDRRKNIAEYGVGGGIVWDSKTEDEYNECLIKARVLTDIKPEFSLIETMLWTPDDGYFLLKYHLSRIEASARYFAFPYDMDQILNMIRGLQASFQCSPQRVRILLDKKGSLSLEAAPVQDMHLGMVLDIALAQKPIRTDTPYVYHKTTNRMHYDEHRSGCTDCDDVLLWNEHGEITECTYANVVVEMDKKLYTPPVTSGLLPGTFRQYLIEQGKISERIILIEDLRQCEHIYLINSVRKWRQAVIMDALIEQPA